MIPLTWSRRIILAATIATGTAGFGRMLVADAPTHPADPAPPAAIAQHQVRTIQGWTVIISDKLLIEQKADTEAAIEMLSQQLAQIVKVVPAEAVQKLRRVPLWLSPQYPKLPPRAEYHPSARWLRDNHRNPEMAQAVEFTNIRIFAQEVKRMPVLVLHELAHAYHHRVLGFDHKAIEAAYRHAVEAKSYERIKRSNGRMERAYAMQNAKEYFAETTEAYFGENDFYPFNREQLREHDPEMYRVLEEVWGVKR